MASASATGAASAAMRLRCIRSIGRWLRAQVSSLVSPGYEPGGLPSSPLAIGLPYRNALPVEQAQRAKSLFGPTGYFPGFYLRTDDSNRKFSATTSRALNHTIRIRVRLASLSRRAGFDQVQCHAATGMSLRASSSSSVSHRPR